jgi:hypothetical protein
VVLRKERLSGAPPDAADPDATAVATPATAGHAPPTARMPAGDATTVPRPAQPARPAAPPQPTRPARPTEAAEAVVPDDGGRWRFGRRRRRTAEQERPGPAAAPTVTKKMPAVDVEDGTSPLAPPGYTLYRPSGVDKTARLEDEQ